MAILFNIVKPFLKDCLTVSCYCLVICMDQLAENVWQRIVFQNYHRTEYQNVLYVSLLKTILTLNGYWGIPSVIITEAKLPDISRRIDLREEIKMYFSLDGEE